MDLVFLADLGQDSSQGDPAEVGHAKQMQPGGRIDAVGVHRHDVGVLEAGKGLGLPRTSAADLQSHRSIRQLPLASQEDTGKRPPPQLLDQVEPANRLAGFGKQDSRGRIGRGRGDRD